MRAILFFTFTVSTLGLTACAAEPAPTASATAEAPASLPGRAGGAGGDGRGEQAGRSGEPATVATPTRRSVGLLDTFA